MHYIDGIGTIAPTESDNALIIGQAMHTGIEKGVETAIDEYFMSYPIIDDGHINEAIKLEYLIPKAKEVLPPGEFEVEIKDDDFHGFIDLLAPATVFERGVEVPNQFDIYDFKYSNNISHYKDSRQLHLYKYFFERNNPGKHIRNLYFLFIPKVSIKQKKTEDLTEFRKRILDELSQKEVKTVQIEYQPHMVIDWLFKVKTVLEATDFEKNPGFLCRYCEYEEFCMKGNDFMLLPKNERRNIEKVEKRVIWIYGVPFCGKTTFANNFPDPLMLNTDGNIKFVDAPYLHIKDEVKVEGRMTKRTQAWEVFKNIVDELEKKDNTFKTLVLDLLEDLYEHCRVYMCGQMGISHESDDSFKAWDKVRSEFLNTLKRLVNLDYENIILISHEDTTKDITKKGGDKITSIKPNMSDKVAVKVAGMVDVVARIIADGEVRTFNFKSNEVIFGGGRLKVDAKDIPLDVAALFKVYDEANKNAANKTNNRTSNTPKGTDNPAKETASDAPVTGRKGRSKKAEAEPGTWTTNTDHDEPVAQPDEVASSSSSEKNEPSFDVAEQPSEETPEASKEEAQPTRTRKSRKSN